ncbi:thioredoxin domain-containing protein 3 [Schistosoma bovis]|uniref:Thioredoxin domain-containing protein 3 n=1 Tax=Schistosoma bovis TaxID=6184 RepID=A0A430QLH2_SCHBO|nr:thioredoxin domain-containing protein 3 [Schistosoma bovis]
MAKKRGEVALQEEIVDEDSWNALRMKQGLIVVDVYQEWCGPCSAVVGLFKRLKTEINDDLLHFAVVRADTVETFELYRGKCEPYFLFFGGGCLVAAVKGVNPPELEQCVLSKLKQEHDVINGEAERVEIRDPMVIARELKEAEIKQKREEEEEVEQELTLAVLKPDVVQSGVAEQIIRELEEKGIQILESQEHLFTTEEAEIFYENVKDQPYFQDLVGFMTSGPSKIIVCAIKGKQGIIDKLRGLIGPSIFEKDSEEINETELAFFYPGYEPSVITVKRTQSVGKGYEETVYGTGKHEIERTVAVLRPQAYELYKDEIVKQIKNAGFTIALEKVIQLTKEQVEEYYKEHMGQPYFGELTTVMSSGPCLALLLAREDAVAKWREMLGPASVSEAKSTAPGSLRAQFTMKSPTKMTGGKSEGINLIHGSANDHEVEKDINVFFPVEKTIAAIKPDAYANRDEIIERIESAGFHVAARKETTLTKDIARKLYENCSGQPFYNDLVNHMVSIRAIYGRDILRNAVHGSSNKDEVQRIQNLLFTGIEATEENHSTNEEMDMDKDEENMLNTPKVNDEENIQSERQQFTNSDDKIQHEEHELTEITTDTTPIGESVEKNETGSSSSSDEENMLNTPKVNDEENIQSERQQFTNSDDKIQHEEHELTEITTDTTPIGESVEKNETSSSSSSVNQVI